MKIYKLISLIFLGLWAVFNCQNSEKSDDNTAALAALAATSTSTSTTTTTVECASGVTTSMSSSLPSWIKDNFYCSTGTVSGSSYVFKSSNLPNHKSYYWGSSSTQYEALPSGNTAAGTNTIKTQSFTYTIPSSPTADSDGTLSGTQAGLSSIGITTNGLAIFNNAAAAPDTLATEAGTFDNYMGHPQKDGIYHHHAGVPKVCDNATSSTSDDTTPTLDSKHGHTAATTHFATATYHYHYAYDSTATIYTLMGSYFYGNVGTVSN